MPEFNDFVEGLDEAEDATGVIKIPAIKDGIPVSLTPVKITKVDALVNTAILNFDLTAPSYQDLNITVNGAVDGDAVYIGVPSGAVVADVAFFGWVSAPDTVTIRAFRVGGGGAANPASGLFTAVVIKQL